MMVQLSLLDQHLVDQKIYDLYFQNAHGKPCNYPGMLCCITWDFLYSLPKYFAPERKKMFKQ